MDTFRRQMADFLARGDVLRELRATRHESQEHVAGAIDVSTKTVREWEKGHGIHWQNAEMIAGYYGVDPDRIAVRKDTVERGVQEVLNGGPAFSDSDSERLRRVEKKIDKLTDILTEDADDEGGDGGLAPEPPPLDPSPPPTAPSEAEPESQEEAQPPQGE